LATKKEQKIVIKASSGLSEDEIQKMVKDAEAHAAEDKKFQEIVGVRNQADAMIHSTEKSLKEFGDKLDASEKSNIESAIESLKEVMKTNDKEAIEEKTKVLTEASHKLAEKMYAQGAQNGPADNASSTQSSAHDEAVDAEYEEVKDNK
jgi:molecular chaperone DnaK